VRTTLRRQVAQRANGRCEYCGWPDWLTPGSFNIEHIYPQVLGGTTEISNLAYSCSGCNNAKYDAIEALDPATGEMAPLYNPRLDKYEEHFWLTNNFELLGRTPTGRATIHRLHLNRSEVIRIRYMLHLFPEPSDWYPSE
jgi:5-methylcytosine-specific restriction endonuclease McrA